MTPMRRDVRALATKADVARAGANELARRARATVETTGAFFLALAGGGTPRPLHEELVARHRSLPWPAVHVFFGDERCVPPDHPDSNYQMARETLLDQLPIRPDNVHRMPGDASDTDVAARGYEATLRRDLEAHGRKGLDFVLLGLGGDGHTASLFPASPALDERTRWVLPSDAPVNISPRARLTLTLPALAAASHVLFLVTGVAKRPALRAVLREDPPPPAGRVVARETVIWLVDREALP